MSFCRFTSIIMEGTLACFAEVITAYYLWNFIG